MPIANKANYSLNIAQGFAPLVVILAIALTIRSPAAEAQSLSSTTADAPSKTKAQPSGQGLTPAGRALASKRPRARGLSWSIKTARIPASGGIVYGTMGFSGLPRLEYHHTIRPDLSLGAMLSFDVGHDHPGDAFDGALLIGVPIRYRKSVGKLDLGIGGVVGMRFPGHKDRDLSVLIEAEANLGFALHHRLLIGGGITAPFWIGAGNKDLVFDSTLLIGPFAEFHVTPPLALTFEAKAGPYFTTSSGKQTSLGLRTTLGIAYRL
jgi:hypothetical protein